MLETVLDLLLLVKVVFLGFSTAVSFCLFVVAL